MQPLAGGYISLKPLAPTTQVTTSPSTSVGSGWGPTVQDALHCPFPFLPSQKLSSVASIIPSGFTSHISNQDQSRRLLTPYRKVVSEASSSRRAILIKRREAVALGFRHRKHEPSPPVETRAYNGVADTTSITAVLPAAP